MVIKNQEQNNYITYGQMNLINEFREYWIDYVIWMRSFVVSTITGFGNLNAISNRLFRIPEDFKDALEPFFGIHLAEEFQRLFMIMIGNAQTIVTAQKNGEQRVIDAAVAALYRNTDELAEFLAKINPYWNKAQWQSLIYRLNGMAFNELTALYSGDYERDLKIVDRMVKLGYLMGDYMARGVINYLVPAEL